MKKNQQHEEKMRQVVLAGLAIILFATMMLTACRKDEAVYSCNPTLNEKIKKNRNANQQITRYQLAHISDLDEQMGIFLSLSNDNRVRIFREKILAEQDNPHLTSVEKAILQNMITFLKPSHYATENQEFIRYAQNQENILRNTYGWDDAKVYIFTNSWMLESEIQDYIVSKMNAPGGGGTSGGGMGGGSLDCTCYYNYYCWLKGGGSGSCVSDGCSKANGGCGVFGTTNCDGRCK